MALIIIDVEDAEAGFRYASSALGEMVPPGPLLRTSSDTDRDLAVRFFSPIADEISKPPGPRPSLILPARWPATLPRAMQRTLTRAALTVGAVLALPPQDPLLERPEFADSLGPPMRPKNALAGVPRVWFKTPQDLPGLAGFAWVNHGPGAGAFRPGVTLLVGERPGIARSGELKHRLPFTTFVRSGCAHWLADELDAVNIPESELYWINAYDVLGVPTDPHFVRRLKPRKTIALGQLAERWCRAGNVEHEAAPHPQYWKRFRSGEEYPLRKLLQWY